MSEKPAKRYTPQGKLIQNTAIKVRLYPTPEQAALFNKTFGCCRYLWNHILADEQRIYQETGKHELPLPSSYKKDAPFLKEVDSSALDMVYQTLRKAFLAFFRNPKTFRHPTPKTKRRSRQSYTSYCHYYPSGKGATIYLTDDGIRLPKVGVVKAKLHRKPLHWWTLKAATVSRTADKYFCSLLFECAIKEPQPVPPNPAKTIGLNYSIPHFYVDSDGGAANPPHWLRESEAKLAQLQRRLSRMQRGSRNYREQLRRIQRLHEHIANQRKDFLHKESHRLAQRWDAVCVRDVNLTELDRLVPNGNVYDAGFGRFRTLLQYKLERQGKRYIIVDRFFPSTKTCHVCGHVEENLPPQKSIWTCPMCNTVHLREQNAAVNIRDKGLQSLS